MKKEDLKIGKTYVVTGYTGTDHSFTKGDEVTYIDDDGSSAPRFKRKSDGEEQYVSVGDIAKKEKKVTTSHDRNAVYSMEASNFVITLRGDGSIVPNLSVKGYSAHETDGGQSGYVSAENLRDMAKQLKKWAKALEASGS